jgi:uncharacterized protein YcfJ
MKKILLTTVALAMALPAYAETVKATITNVEPRYQYRDVVAPVEHCVEVQTPIYGTVQGGNAGEGALTGMIIGGLLGKGVTGDDGGAAAGAVIGGIIGADKAQNKQRQVITGYKNEVQCEVVYEQTQERVVSDYLITYEWNGVMGQSYTYNNYHVGQRIPVKVSIEAK